MRILIAEDEPEIWKPYQIALEARNHQVTITETGTECLRIYYNELSKKQDANLELLSSSSEKSNSNVDSFPSPVPSPFDVVILDYRIPEKDGMEVAREIVELNPDQRLIFASAYVKETLEDSVKQLKKVVELLQKPFELDVLIETVEDVAVYAELKKLMTSAKYVQQESEPTQEQMRDLFEGLRNIQRGRISLM
jgi:CheY-like chemotaxis protein